MDSKRLLLAVLLSAAAYFVINSLFPIGSKPAAGTSPAGDTTAVATSSTPATTSSAISSAASSTPESSATLSVAQDNNNSTTVGAAANGAAVSSTSDPTTLVAPSAQAIVAETTVVKVREDSGAVFTFSNVGAAPVAIGMNAYKFTTETRKGEQILLQSGADPLIKYQIVTNKKTQIDLSHVAFSVQRDSNSVTYQGTADGQPVSLQYHMTPDGHEVHVSGTIPGIDNGFLLVSLPSTLPATEKDTTQDFRNLGYAYLSKREGARRVLFSSLDPGEKTQIEGPITWVAAKNKYFVVGILTPDSGTSFAEMTITGGARVSKVATHAHADIVIPITNGVVAFDMYAGPQEWKRLHELGRNFDEVNPYGWAFLSGFLQPIATGVIRLVLWMHQQLALSYGLILVVLGFLVRIVLWPLNQTAMRTSLKMQEFQPKIQAAQAKYKDNPERQREEIMKLYKEHGMSPFSPFMGCLPMLLPMPVLFALFFVFQNTIEFRGVPFLWVPDLSTHDPFYIWPILMAVSMFFLSWIGMRNAPPNPQSKMMSYIMPVVLLVFLARMAAGLNVYYAVQNIAALPQQWLIAREQAKRKAAAGAGKEIAASAVSVKKKRAT